MIDSVVTGIEECMLAHSKGGIKWGVCVLILVACILVVHGIYTPVLLAYRVLVTYHLWKACIKLSRHMRVRTALSQDIVVSSVTLCPGDFCIATINGEQFKFNRNSRDVNSHSMLDCVWHFDVHRELFSQEDLQ